MQITRWTRFLILGLALIAVSLPAQPVLTLPQALDIALDKSPDIQRARFNLERSRQLLKAQEASLKSKFSLNLMPYDYQYTKRFNTYFSEWNTEEIQQSGLDFSVSQPIYWTDGTLSLINSLARQEAFSAAGASATNSTFNNNLYLRLEQPLFTYNRTKLSQTEVELDLENAALSYALKRLELEKSVTQSFFDCFYNEQNQDIAVAEEKNNQESYDIIRNKVEAGLAAKEELYQAELNFANSRLSTANARVSLANSKDALKDLLGLSLFDEVSADADVEFSKIPVDLEKATKSGLSTRMEIREQEITIRNAMNDLIRTSALNEFKGNVSLTYGLLGNNEAFSSMYDDPTQNQKYSISFEVPLWDWGEKDARIKAQEAKIAQQKLNANQTENQIILGIRQAFRTVENQLLQIETRKQNVRNAELTYDLNLERYRNGDLTSKLLGEYQTQLSKEKLAYMQALIQYRLALLDLKIQSMWDFEKGLSVTPALENE